MTMTATRSLGRPPQPSDTARGERGPAGGTGAMFDRIARRYDLLNRINSFGLDRSWRRKSVEALGLSPGSRVLDLATGTADVAIEVLRQEPRATVIGLDTSPRMLDVGRHKVEAAGLSERIELRTGDACELPLEDASVDGVVIAFGIRNVPDRARALREMARVTRPQGRLVVLELNEPRSGFLAPLARFHIHRVVPRLGAWLSGSREYRYLEESIAAFPPPQEFIDMVRGAGCLVIAVRPLAFGACYLFIAEREVKS